MNKQLSPTQLADVVSAFPVMTKKEKLLRFAQIIRAAKQPFVIFNGIEYLTLRELDKIVDPRSAFAAAAADSVLRDAGMPATGTAGDAKRFFELTAYELHAFTCNCGGHISNEDMAKRVEWIAERA